MSDNPLKLEIEAVINDGQMEQSMSKIKNKLKDIESINKGQSPQLSPQAEQMKNQQSKIMMDMQKRYTEDLANRHVQISKTMGDTEKLYQNQLLSQKSKVELQEKMLRLLKEQKQIEDTLGLKSAPPVKTEPAIPGGAEESGIPSKLRQLLKPAALAAAAAAVVNAGLQVAQQEITAESKKIAFQTSAITKASAPLREVYEGRGMEGQFFRQERLKALDVATKQGQRQEKFDTAKILGATGVGAATGAAAGSAFLGIGAIPGAILGGIGGLATGILGSDRGYSKVFDQDRYQSMLAAESMENFQKTEANLRAQNVPATLALESQKRFGGGLLQTQRATGLSDEALMSNFQENMQFGGGKYGFQDIMSARQELMQAGASTKDLQGDLAGRIASAEQYGITSAGTAMGKLSTVEKGGMTTDEAFGRVLSKAVETGVNASDLAEMPQELNRFTAMATDLATSGGGFSESIMSKFAQAITDLESKASLEGAKGFLQQYQQKAGTVVGMEGQMGYGFLQGDKAAQIIGAEAQQKIQDEGLTFTLNKLTSKEFEENPTLIKGIAARIGVSPDKLKELIESKEEAKQITTKPQAEAIEQFKTARDEFEARKKEIQQTKEEKGIQALSAEEIKALDTKFEDTEEGAILSSKITQARAEAEGEGFRFDLVGRAGDQFFKGGKKPAAGGEELAGMLAAPKQGSLEEQRRAAAFGDITQMENLNKFLDAFGAAAANVDKSSLMINEALSVFAETLKTGGKEAMASFQAEIKKSYGVDDNKALVEAFNMLGSTQTSLQPK